MQGRYGIGSMHHATMALPTTVVCMCGTGLGEAVFRRIDVSPARGRSRTAGSVHHHATMVLYTSVLCVCSEDKVVTCRDRTARKHALYCKRLVAHYRAVRVL